MLIKALLKSSNKEIKDLRKLPGEQVHDTGTLEKEISGHYESSDNV